MKRIAHNYSVYFYSLNFSSSHYIYFKMNDFIKSIKKETLRLNQHLALFLTYPGVKAVFFHQIANFFHLAGFH